MSESRYRILRFDSPRDKVSQRVYHAVQPGAISALCGKRPHGNSRWFIVPGRTVTCLMCLACLKRSQRRTT
jgi:hypothetical protein